MIKCDQKVQILSQRAKEEKRHINIQMSSLESGNLLTGGPDSIRRLKSDAGNSVRHIMAHVGGRTAYGKCRNPRPKPAREQRLLRTYV